MWGKSISFIVDTSGLDIFEYEGMPKSTAIIRASLERDEGLAFADRNAKKLKARHPCDDDDDVNGRLG